MSEASILGLRRHKLNKPSQLDGGAVDLSHYDSILRSLLGADAAFSVESADWTTVVFSLGASYRTFDEPFVTDFSRQTVVGLSTKARKLDRHYCHL
jgi:hypothetical protein